MLLTAALPAAAVAGGVAETYADAAGRILGAETVQGQAWPLLRHLTDRVGPRLSGSAGAEAAVRWAAERLKADGLEVRVEPVMVPHWVRGEETAEIVAPATQKLAVTALGGSDPTPEAGLTAEVVEAASFEELHALGAGKVHGKIVLFNRPMTKDAGYGVVAPLRTRGAVEAARMGAVASLVRSLGTASMRLPHTGAMDYDAEVPHIPAAAVSSEDADLLHRLLESGEPVRVRLRLRCQRLPDAPSANVVADLPGRQAPDQVVLIGAHLDSWDLGTGAIDDGAGVAMVMESLRLLKSLGLRPRRTIRGVLFMNEENGLRGGEGYAEQHRAELSRHVAAIETDGGGARPLGFGATTGPGGLVLLREIASLLRGIGADRVHEGGGGADISPLRAASVPVLGLDTDGTHYFDWHHTAADTLDKVDPQELAQGAAALAVMAYVLADMPEALPHPAPPEPVRP
jgi:Zn-dependent M28 family amino/carboxypeptidase